MKKVRRKPKLSLGAKQELFSDCWSKLLRYAIDELGLAVRHGETWRHPASVEYMVTHGLGIRNTLHGLKLAGDGNFFFKGEWLDGSKEHHIGIFKKLGEFWKKLHPLCTWGGDFRRKDYGHFSITHNGVR